MSEIEEIKKQLNDITSTLKKLTTIVLNELPGEENLDPFNVEDQVKHAIGDVFEYFDFDKVEKMMNAVGWQWPMLGHKITANDIKEEVKKYIERVIKEKTSISCGGLEYIYRNPEDSAELEGYEPEEGIWPTVEVKFVGESIQSSFY